MMLKNDIYQNILIKHSQKSQREFKEDMATPFNIKMKKSKIPEVDTRSHINTIKPWNSQITSNST